MRSAHGFGMGYAIDLLFIDAQGAIVHVAPLMPAAIAACREARHVLEMRSGEIARLGLQPPMRPRMVLVDDIFREGGRQIEPPAPAGDLHVVAVEGTRPLPLLAMVGVLFAGVIASTLMPGIAFAEPTDEGMTGITTASRRGSNARAGTSRGASTAGSSPSSLREPTASTGRVVPAQLLRLLEEQAEAIYREGGEDTDGRELVEIYEALAELAADRSQHAWLRIGNIRQRAGSVGAAIDAYRRVHAPVEGSAVPAESGAGQGGRQATATAPMQGSRQAGVTAAVPSNGSLKPAEVRVALAAERKALLNLTALALEQARQSLARLDSLPPAAGLNASGGEAAPATAAPGGDESATAGLRHRMESLAQAQAEQQRRAGEPSAFRSSLPSPGGTQMVERYTASARRNAVKVAKGSLHVDPTDELPARPVPKPRSAPVNGYLPNVEYLLGDPLRLKQHTAGEGDSPGAAAGDSAKATETEGTNRKRSAGGAGGNPGGRLPESAR